nr:MAG TPA: hypothetical protein [Caudoviricetes sp.]
MFTSGLLKYYYRPHTTPSKKHVCGKPKRR